VEKWLERAETERKQQALSVIDLIILTLMEHEKRLDEAAGRLERATENLERIVNLKS